MTSKSCELCAKIHETCDLDVELVGQAGHCHRILASLHPASFCWGPAARRSIDTRSVASASRSCSHCEATSEAGQARCFGQGGACRSAGCGAGAGACLRMRDGSSLVSDGAEGGRGREGEGYAVRVGRLGQPWGGGQGQPWGRGAGPGMGAWGRAGGRARRCAPPPPRTGARARPPSRKPPRAAGAASSPRPPRVSARAGGGGGGGGGSTAGAIDRVGDREAAGHKSSGMHMRTRIADTCFFSTPHVQLSPIVYTRHAGCGCSGFHNTRHESVGLPSNLRLAQWLPTGQSCSKRARPVLCVTLSCLCPMAHGVDELVHAVGYETASTTTAAMCRLRQSAS